MFPYLNVNKSSFSNGCLLKSVTTAKLAHKSNKPLLQRFKDCLPNQRISQSPSENPPNFPPNLLNGGNDRVMRCKIHPSDTGAGVCAACLRERLTTLSAAVANAGDADYSPEIRRNLGRLASPNSFGLRPADPDSERNHIRRFSFISFLIAQSKQRETNSDSEAAKPSRTRSWLPSMIRRRRVQKTKKRTPNPIAPRFTVGEWVSDRGMSPAEKEESTDFESDSGYHTDPLPMRHPETNHYCGRQRNRNYRLAGFSLCFSPLMRPSPGKRKNQAPSEIGFSGELRGGFNNQRNRYGGASAGGNPVLGPNRSRKIADFGKFR